MARMTRVVVPGFPHHVIQRGNRRQKVFFNDDDYVQYLKFLDKYSSIFNLDILCYCLMPNHIHLIATPNNNAGLAQAIGETHRNYTRFINFREQWRGYLWQGRFSSYVLDERYLLSAVRYILLNPVKSKLVTRPWDYKWSSARHHMMLKSNSLLKDDLLKGVVGDWKQFLDVHPKQDDSKLLQLHERTGRLLGGNAFIDKLESVLKIELKKKKPGCRKKEK